MTTEFLAGWQDYPPRPDPTMTRERLARLMRAWRRSKTQGRRNFTLDCTSRKPGERVYEVATTRYVPADRHTIIVRTTHNREQTI